MHNPKLTKESIESGSITVRARGDVFAAVVENHGIANKTFTPKGMYATAPEAEERASFFRAHGARAKVKKFSDGEIIPEQWTERLPKSA